jgi:hypothetical protein
MKYKCFLIALSLTECLIQAQTNFKPGYIIKTNNDTVYGEIDYRGDLLMGEVCTFKPKGLNEETKFSPNDIAGFRFIDSKYFISKEINEKKVFLEFLIKGKINIYYLRDINGDHYFLEKEGIKISELPYEEVIKYKDGTPYLYESTRHMGVLNAFTQDAPGFQTRIEQIKKPEHRNLIKLAEDYHNKVCQGEKCIIYEKDIPLFKVNAEISAGIAKYYYTTLDNKNHAQAGILVYVWMPRINENMFLRTGALYSSIRFNGKKYLLIKIPLQIEYVYPKGIIRPKAAFGVNLYKPIWQTLAITGGLDIKVYKALYVSLNCDFDFVPDENFGLLPRDFFSYSILPGLYLKF